MERATVRMPSIECCWPLAVRLAELERSTDLESAIVWAVTRPDDDTALGWVTLMHVREGVDEVGIILRRQVWRRGYAREAIGAAITYGFETQRKHRMVADIDPDNEASIRLFDRLGFTLEGHLRDNWLISGKRYDSVIYGLLDHEWRARGGAG